MFRNTHKLNRLILSDQVGCAHTAANFVRTNQISLEAGLVVVYRFAGKGRNLACTYWQYPGRRLRPELHRIYRISAEPVFTGPHSQSNPDRYTSRLRSLLDTFANCSCASRSRKPTRSRVQPCSFSDIPVTVAFSGISFPFPFTLSFAVAVGSRPSRG